MAGDTRFNRYEIDGTDYYFIIVRYTGEVEVYTSHPDDKHPFKLYSAMMGFSDTIREGDAVIFVRADSITFQRLLALFDAANQNADTATSDDAGTDDDDGEAGNGEGDIDTVPGSEYIDPQQSKSIVDSIRERFTADLCDVDVMNMYR